jgi:hypothetical protein
MSALPPVNAFITLHFNLNIHSKACVISVPTRLVYTLYSILVFVSKEEIMKESTNLLHNRFYLEKCKKMERTYSNGVLL